ncbi:MAG: hypothetical protein KJ614_07820 [Gammaproteobacteria bacterium]|nr:hypothetical protein [Rhodoferax sp.]MBU3898820.1 hypothetical protein [Gammaproteobacteria bacterium]MBU3999011.1 hypothetical protein [Gammaproteobacteria bacterium]MBU4019296.1 hypothetical protein [Gammaproteobacteria bacterium]MBU4081860.1 hypothetical protein [Gammaproteobacteria bacterium]
MPRRAWTWFLAALLLTSPLAHSQAVCSSDAQAAPKLLFERFINADCESCWSDAATAVAPPGALALDWIVPGSQGEEAALAGAASRDALLRLSALQRDRPHAQSSEKTKVHGWPGASLRVAHGPALGGYVGASIALSLPANQAPNAPLQAWLVLVETLPAGFEGSPVPRNLVRNVFQPTWNMRDALSIKEHLSFKEIRPLNIPEGAKSERLRVFGWVQDATGRVAIAAESICPSEQTE